MTPLFATINAWRGQPFVWGERDCCTVVADWVAQVRGVDPMADVRLTYATAGECQRVTRFFSDPVGTWERYLAPLGLPRTDAPVAGDVGILLHVMDGAVRPCGGLCLGGGIWAAKSLDGAIADRPPRVVAAWAVGWTACAA